MHSPVKFKMMSNFTREKEKKNLKNEAYSLKSMHREKPLKIQTIQMIKDW